VKKSRTVINTAQERQKDMSEVKDTEVAGGDAMDANLSCK